LSPTADKFSSDTEDDGIPKITHSVIFKSIGVHKEMEYQEIFALANRNSKDSKLG